MATLWRGAQVIGEWAEPAGPSGPASSLLADNGRIVALGDAADERAADAEVIELNGGVLAPAFGDGHLHLGFAGSQLLGPQIRECASIEAILAEVGRYAAEHPELPWIIGSNYEATLAPDGVFDARWLDHVDRPVALYAWDHHTLWVNSAALRAAGIDSHTPDPPLGRIVRRGDGSPLGLLQETPAMDLVLSRVPQGRGNDLAAAVGAAGTFLKGLGYGLVQDAWVETEAVGAYIAAARSGALPQRTDLALRADPLRWPDQLPDLLAAREAVRSAGLPRLSADTIKVFVDGIVENRTAAMLETYCDCGHRGVANWEQRVLDDLVRTCTQHGFAVHFHAIGDAAVRSALDAVEASAAAGSTPTRPAMAHIQVLDPADLDRFARLGITAVFQPLWAQNDAVMRDLTVPGLGDERALRQYRIGSMMRSGARVSFGSDWPVTHADWRWGAYTAVTRCDSDGQPAEGWLPAERITVAEALHAYSAGVATQLRQPDRGRLTPGSVADLVWLDRDPRTVEPEQLPGLAVRGTWLADGPAGSRSQPTG